MFEDCMDVDHKCHECQIHGVVLHQPPNSLHPTIASWPFECWGIDIVGPIDPLSSKGHRFILATTDYFSKWAEAIPPREVKAHHVLEFFHSHIVHRFGTPRRIISDNGMAFRSTQINSFVRRHVNKNDPPTQGPFLANRVPKDFSGLRKMLQYLKEHYGNPPIYIHENGFATEVNSSLNDTKRIEYLKGYIGSTLEANRNGVRVEGYFVWSFLDVFEFIGGYKNGFGLYHVDFNDEKLPRTPRLSAHWYANFLKNDLSVALRIERVGLEDSYLYSQ